VEINRIKDKLHFYLKKDVLEAQERVKKKNYNGTKAKGREIRVEY